MTEMCWKYIYLCQSIGLIVYLLLIDLNNVHGHGRLVDPPSRSSAWRYGFKTEPNYNDNQLFCGGFTTQWKINRGKCGICGDPFNGRKDNELPNGKYAKRLVITRTYREGDVIESKVELTANHNGFFVFKVCPTVTDSKEVTQKCLDRFLLNVVNSNATDKYIVPSNRAQMFTIKLKLPNGLSCNLCLFQWTYTSANNWGKCLNGSSAVGCGPQETFRGCADITIVDRIANMTEDELFMDRLHSSTAHLLTNFNEIIDNNNEKLETTEYPIVSTPESKLNENKCHSIGIWKNIPTMDEWCLVNCAANYCPQTHCKCV